MEDITMNLEIASTKYSIFGDYSFLKAETENISKLFGFLGQDGFLPNMLQMIQIDQLQRKTGTVYRPQFVNSNTNCVISFLPERIDYETTTYDKKNIDTFCSYISQIQALFDIKISRIALTSNINNQITKALFETIRSKNIVSGSYPYSDNLIELDYRVVSRQDCFEIAEKVNVGQHIQAVLNQENAALLHIDTDINTLGENKENRFDSNSCVKFFNNATAWNDQIIKQFGDSLQ